MHRASNIWWLPLARRTFGWSLAGALLWALPVAAAIASLALYVHLNPSPPEPNAFIIDNDGIFIGILFWLCVISSSILALMGALSGGLAAFYAPPKDVKNPMKSRFFRLVNGQTFWFTAATSLACALTLGFALYPVVGFFIAFAVWLALSIALFGMGLWRAVNRALSEAATSNCNP